MSYLGTVYIICFERHFKRAKHYVGFSQYVEKRLNHHRNGNGAALIRAVNNAGIGWEVSRTFLKVERSFERRVKNLKNIKKYCPNCSGTKTRRVEFYAPPPTPNKRKYKIVERAAGGFDLVFSDIERGELFRRIEKRLHVGEIIHINERKFQRTDRRKSKTIFLELTGAAARWTITESFRAAVRRSVEC